MSAPNLLFFDRFHNRYRVEARFVARTGLRIGAGRSDELGGTDLPVLRVGREDHQLIIPGSTWKGIIRSASETILRSATPSGAPWQKMACDPFGAKPKNPADTAGRCLGDFKPKDEKRSAEQKVQDERAFVAAGICQACALFGAEGLASHARFSDSVFEASTRIRDGVGLSRDLGRAEDGIKYDYEIIEPSACVAFVLDVDNAHPWQMGLLLAVIAEIGRGGLRVGGAGSRGLGWLELEGSPTVIHYANIRQVLTKAPPAPLDQEQIDALGVALDRFLDDPFASELPCTA